MKVIAPADTFNHDQLLDSGGLNWFILLPHATTKCTMDLLVCCMCLPETSGG